MTTDAPTNAGKHVTSNIACVCCQRYTKYSVFWLSQMTLCVTTLHKYLPFVEASVVISSVMSIRQFTEYDYEDGEGRREHNCSSFQKDYDYDELNIEERALFNQRLRKICPEGYMEKIVGHRPCIKSFTLYKVRT